MWNRTKRIFTVALVFWTAIFSSFSCASVAPRKNEKVSQATKFVFFQTPFTHATAPSQLHRPSMQLELLPSESRTKFVALPALAPAIGYPVLTMSGPPGWIILTVAVVGGVVAVIYMSAGGSAGGQDEIDKAWESVLRLTAEMEEAQAAAEDAYEARDLFQATLWEDDAYQLSMSISDLMNLVELLENGGDDPFLQYGP